MIKIRAHATKNQMQSPLMKQEHVNFTWDKKINASLWKVWCFMFFIMPTAKTDCP